MAITDDTGSGIPQDNPQEPGVLADGPLDELAASTPELIRAVNALSREAAANREANRVTRRRTVVQTIALGVLTVVVAGLIFVLNATFVTQREQVATRTRVLCPLYTLLLASVDPAKRAALPPEQRKQYDQTVVVIRSGYDALSCAQLSPAPPPH